MNPLLEPFEHMLKAIATPEDVRAVERGGSATTMWQAIVESGFLDALVGEDQGGAGLSLADVHPLWQALGRHTVPLPVGETMIARRLLADAGAAIPDGPIALIAAGRAMDVVVPFGRTATHVLVETGDRLHLMETARAVLALTGVHGSTAAWLCCDGLAGSGVGASPMGGLRALGATLRAALISGAADRLTMMTASFANERVQFGKPIGRQQAMQQYLAVMAEDMVAARIASQIACAGAFPPVPNSVATAKSIASAAAARIAATAHAVHGAIGISSEYDLQLLTRRLYEWRLADGSETYWNRKLGAARLGLTMRSVDFVRTQVTPEPVRL